ncbi:MAG: hypothetical protein HQL64_16975 [Magnetococcales bacterium]|nr:hypothetical protein [Magnetococcales bacterium]
MAVSLAGRIAKIRLEVLTTMVTLAFCLLAHMRPSLGMVVCKQNTLQIKGQTVQSEGIHRVWGEEDREMEEHENKE